MGINIGSVSNIAGKAVSGVSSLLGSSNGNSSALSTLGTFGTDKTSVSSDMNDAYSSNPLASAMSGTSTNTSGFMSFLQNSLGSMGVDCSSADSTFGRIQSYSEMFGAMHSILGSMIDSELEELLEMLENLEANSGNSGSSVGSSGSGSGNSGVSSSVPSGSASSAISSGDKVGTAKGTGYYPDNSLMEGGYNDMRGNKLRTLQDYLNGDADYVSIALDKNLYKNGTVKYGDTFRIPELEEKYGKKIIFKAVDTGGAFTDKGFSRVDICTANQSASCDSTVNGNLTLIKC